MLPGEKMYEGQLQSAVRHFWATRTAQVTAQKKRKSKDQGGRSAVTGGKQMDGFISLFRQVALDAGVSPDAIHFDKKLELPGFFRPEKKWDFLIVREGRLIAVIETKSQVGSFGNNFNNRAEEALGNSQDIWTAYREGAFGASRPWIGFLFLLEDCEDSSKPVRLQEPHFSVFDEFRDTSYTQRYELLLRKLMLERCYSHTALLLSSQANGLNGDYRLPSEELSPELFIASFRAHLGAFF